MTRAKKGLNISYARYRTVRGQLMRTIPSQFLSELGSVFSDIRQPQPEQREEFNQSQESIAAAPEFVPGQLVRHNSFGLGRVKNFVDMGANSIVLVQFNTGQTKSLMLKYANLSKVDH